MGIGKRIKKRRIEIGITQSELSKRLSVTPSAIANYENDISHPKEDVLYKLFDVLQCDANYLFKDEIEKFNTCNVIITEKEKRLIDSYNNHPEMQEAIDKLLGIDNWLII